MSGLFVLAITLYEGVILVRAIASWLAPQSTHPALELLRKLTEPVLKPVRDLLPTTSGIDLSPLLVLVGLELVKRILI
jgi:YggT family protein